MKTRRWGPAALAVAALVWTAASAAGQTAGQPPKPPDLGGKSLEELMGIKVESVFGAAKRDQRVTDAPSSVTIVTAEDILTFGWRTLADVLRSVRGFYTTYDRNYAYLGARGFGRPSDYNNRTLLLVDGHRFNDNVYDGAFIGTDFPIDVSLIDRIEIIRGPGAALYGTSAFFAVINVITRSGGAVGGVEATVDAGSFGSIRGQVSTGWTGHGMEGLLAAGGFRSAGPGDLYYPEFDSPATSFGVSSGNDGDAGGSVFGRVNAGGFVVQGLFGSREKHLPTASYGTTFNDPRTRTTDQRGWIDVLRRFQAGPTTLTARASYDRMNYDGTYIYDEGATVNRDLARGDWATGELIATRSAGGKHVFTGGVEYRYNFVQDQTNFDAATPADLVVDERRHSSQIGVYGQAELALHPKLTATLGGRYDRWSLVGGSGRPRVGVVFKPGPETALKLLYGGAYRAPNLYELFYGDQITQLANPDLEPESLRTTEAVVEHYFGGRVRVTAVGYWTAIDELISQEETPGGYFIYRNQEHVRAAGAEFETEARWPSGLLARANYSYQRVTDRDTGAVLSNAPRHLGNLDLAAPLFTRGVTLALDTRFVGSRLTRSGTELSGDWLANLVVVARPRRWRLTVSAGIGNLFDRTYADPVGAEFLQEAIEQNGRTAFVRATVRF